MAAGRLSRAAPRRVAAAMAAVLLGLANGGCSYKLGGLFADKPEQTGTPKPTRVDASESADLPPEQDLVVAKAAVNDVLSRGDRDTSLPWENPRTGAHGTVTPIAAAHAQDGFTCRDFLASYVRAGTESWLQGEACRIQGKWEVKALRPLKRT
jgi:17 kDa outer membrane surface antigen